jgi:hypothetical protein
MTETRAFPLADVLSVTTPNLLSARRMDGLTDLLNWMTGDDLELWQLPRAADEARPVLIAQHPFLADLQPPTGLSTLGLHAWLMTAILKTGGTLTISPLADWVHQHPVQELVDRIELAKLRTAG